MYTSCAEYEAAGKDLEQLLQKYIGRYIPAYLPSTDSAYCQLMTIIETEELAQLRLDSKALKEMKTKELAQLRLAIKVLKKIEFESRCGNCGWWTGGYHSPRLYICSRGSKIAHDSITFSADERKLFEDMW